VVMTSAATILALLPVLTSTGRGSDIMVPMAIPSFGGMAVASKTWFVVHILYCWAQEWKFRLSHPRPAANTTVPLAQGDSL
jgi:copper/silver efflux system protein